MQCTMLNPVWWNIWKWQGQGLSEGCEMLSPVLKQHSSAVFMATASGEKCLYLLVEVHGGDLTTDRLTLPP